MSAQVASTLVLAWSFQTSATPAILTIKHPHCLSYVRAMVTFEWREDKKKSAYVNTVFLQFSCHIMSLVLQ